MNKKRMLILAGILLVVIIVMVILIVNGNKGANNNNNNGNVTEKNYTAVQPSGDKDNVSKEFLKEKAYNGMTINNIRFYFKDGESHLTMTFVNDTATRTEGFNATLQFIDEKGNVVKEAKNVYIPAVRANGGNEFSYTEAGDIVNVYSFKFVK